MTLQGSKPRHHLEVGLAHLPALGFQGRQEAGEGEVCVMPPVIVKGSLGRDQRGDSFALEVRGWHRAQGHGFLSLFNCVLAM